MSTLENSLATFQVPPGRDRMTVARELAAHLEANGHVPYVMESLDKLTGLALVHVRETDEDHVVMVHTGDLPALRRDMEKLLQTVNQGDARHVVAAVPIPPDIEQLVGQSDLARLELVLSRMIPLSTPLTEVDRLAHEVAPVIGDVLGRDLDLASPDVLRTIDELLIAIRPVDHEEPIDESFLPPVFTLIGLGLVATEVVRQRHGRGELGVLSNMGWQLASTLHEAGGFPALSLGDAKSNVAGKVRKRWYYGKTDSLRDMGDHLAVTLSDVSQGSVEETLDEAQTAAREAAVLEAVAVAGSHLQNTLGSLLSGDLGMPTAWRKVDGAIQMNVLAVEGSGQAEAMVTKLRDDGTGQCLSAIIDYFMQDPRANERLDALKVAVFVPGTPVHLVVMVPYRPGDPVTFPKAPQLVRRHGVPESLTNERMAEVFFADLPTDGPLADLPRTLSTSVHDDTQRFLGGTEPEELSDADQDLLMRLAALAPAAGFLMVAAADGKVEESEINAFQEALQALKDPLVMLIAVRSPVSGSQGLQMLVKDTTLVARSLAAMGVLLARSENGAASRKALMALWAQVAGVHGAIRPEEMGAAMQVSALLDGGTATALRGGDPFPEIAIAPELVGLLKEAALAPYAGFLLVAAADGQIEEREVHAFTMSMALAAHPLLKRVIDTDTREPTVILRQLAENTSLISSSLGAFGRICREHPDGAEAREAFLRSMYLIAGGQPGEKERRALRAIEQALDGSSGGGCGVSLLLVGGGILLALLVILYLLLG